MPDATVTAIPFVFKKPTIKIGTTGTSVDIACAANNLTVEADQDENTVETFCATYTTYKAPVWTITITCVQSFGTGGLWNQLVPLAGTIQDFEIIPDASKAVSADNPAMRGKAYVGWPSFLDGAVGEASEFDLELGVQGLPTFPITPTVFEAGQTEQTEQTEPETASA